MNDLTVMTARTESLINAISDAILNTVEVAAERLNMASEVARVNQRLQAFGAVLEAVGVQKQALIEKMADATGPMKSLLKRQIQLLTLQEEAILVKTGIDQTQAHSAVEKVDKPMYERNGKRFQRLQVTEVVNTDKNGNGHKDE